MAKRKKSPPVPPYQAQHRKRDISPGPKSVLDAKVIEDDATRELPVVRRPRKAAAPRAAAPRPSGTTYSSRGRTRAHRAGAIAGAVGEAGSLAAQRAAIRQSAGGKPSVAGRAGSGALAGAGAGAAIGTAVGGPVGTAVGAGVGAVGGGVVGGAAGAKDKRAWRAAMKADTAGPRKALVAELLICLVITALSPMTKNEDTPGRLVKQFTALLLLFFGLGLLTSAGRGAARVAAAAGGVVTLVLVVSQRDFLVKIAEIFNRGNKAAPTSRRPAGAQAGN